MILDRLLVADMIKFIEPVIPADTNSGKNCLFIRVEDGKLICCGGNEFVIKRVILVSENAIEQSGKAQKKGALPQTFMIPRPELSAFKELMDEHKAFCKKMAKNDPSYLHVEITENELISHNSSIPYEQPSHEFKNMEMFFEIKQESIPTLTALPQDLTACLTGFKKSGEVEITFSGPQKPVHFIQGDYEAMMLPPTEKKESDDFGEQIEIGEDDE
jgi:hypothetical protein